MSIPENCQCDATAPYVCAECYRIATGLSSAPSCAYSDHHEDRRLRSVVCEGPAVFTAHDVRGCRPVCFAHAEWLRRHSWAFGHSTNCPGWPAILRRENDRLRSRGKR